MVNTCCVTGCHSRSNRERYRFFLVPSVVTKASAKLRDLTEKRRRVWIERINRKSITDSTARMWTRLCAKHFVSGKPSSVYKEEDVDWAPSLFMEDPSEGKAKHGLTKEDKDLAEDFKEQLWWPSEDHTYCFPYTSRKGQCVRQAEEKARKDAMKRYTRSQERTELCCVAGCVNRDPTTRMPKATLFPFPSQKSRCRKWVQNSKQTILEGKSPLQLSLEGHKMCYLHFDATQFKSPRLPRTLEVKAVPRLFGKTRRPERKKLVVRLSNRMDGGGEEAGVSVEVDRAVDPAYTLPQHLAIGSGEGHGNNTITVTLSCQGIVDMDYEEVPPEMKFSLSHVKTEPINEDELLRTHTAFVIESDDESTSSSVSTLESDDDDEFENELNERVGFVDGDTVDACERRSLGSAAESEVGDFSVIKSEPVEEEHSSRGSVEDERHALTLAEIKSEPVDDNDDDDDDDDDGGGGDFLVQIKSEPIEEEEEEDFVAQSAEERHALTLEEIKLEAVVEDDDFWVKNAAERHSLMLENLKSEPVVDDVYNRHGMAERHSSEEKGRDISDPCLKGQPERRSDARVADEKDSGDRFASSLSETSRRVRDAGLGEMLEGGSNMGGVGGCGGDDDGDGEGDGGGVRLVSLFWRASGGDGAVNWVPLHPAPLS
ncbi:hypothetical protein ACOMHN_013780 [Nucella lapillus]